MCKISHTLSSLLLAMSIVLAGLIGPASAEASSRSDKVMHWSAKQKGKHVAKHKIWSSGYVVRRP